MLLRGRIGPKLFHHLEAVHLRHHNIEHETRSGLSDRAIFEALLAVFRQCHLVTAQLQSGHHFVGDDFDILGDEDETPGPG